MSSRLQEAYTLQQIGGESNMLSTSTTQYKNSDLSGAISIRMFAAACSE